MENVLNILLEISKLKEMAKVDWILMRIKNPEKIVPVSSSLLFLARY